MRFALTALLVLAACNSDKNGGNEPQLDDISNQTLSGVIGGDDWIFASGETSFFLSDEVEFFASLSGETGQPCGFDAADTDFLLSVPTEVGTFAFTGSRNATFVDDNDNFATFDGTVRVDSITADTIVGGVYAYYDDDNEIDGNFTLTRCPE